MASNVFYESHANDIICSDCENAFLRSEFPDYMKTFQLCADCQRKNPQITDSGNGPIEQRLSQLMHQLEFLNADLDTVNNICHEDDD